MFDANKMQDVAVRADANGQPVLLTNRYLTFGALVDTQTGAVLNAIREANDRGLKFTITPRQVGGYRVEVNGSIHRFYNDGLHNADDFTVDGLLTALDRFVTDYGVDPFASQLNNVEFGVNVRLPFPAVRVLDNLVSYKNQLFKRETEKGATYYQCKTQRYVLKIYDKGTQYGVGDNLLRVEVKVLTMAYLTRLGIHINTLADLLTITNYERLGALLTSTFATIVFDDPTINPAALSEQEQSIYQKGCNPRFWHIPKGLPAKQATALRQQLHRAKRSYRALLDRYGCANYQRQTITLIREKWAELTTVSDQLLTSIDERRAAWKNDIETTHAGGQWCNQITLTTPPACHELTGGNQVVCCDVSAIEGPEPCHELTDPGKPEMSQINPLSLMLNCDMTTAPTDQRQCPVTGFDISHQRASTRYVSAATVWQWYDLDRERFIELAGRFLTPKQAGADLKKQCYHIAHNIRNADTNGRNNPVRRLKKYAGRAMGYSLPLFPVTDTLKLPDRVLAALDYRRGTPYEIRL